MKVAQVWGVMVLALGLALPSLGRTQAPAAAASIPLLDAQLSTQSAAATSCPSFSRRDEMRFLS